MCVLGKFGLFAQFIDPCTSFAEMLKLGIGRNEGTSHLHNATPVLVMILKVGEWIELGFTQKVVSNMATNWGGEGRMSQFTQCYNSLASDQDVLSEALKDLGKPAAELRVYDSMLLHRLFKCIKNKSAILEVTLLKWLFKNAESGTSVVRLLPLQLVVLVLVVLCWSCYH